MRSRGDIADLLREVALVCAVGSVLGGQAQDAVLSSPTSAPLLLNPAMAGALHDVEANLAHRDQRNGSGPPFRTIMAGVDGVVRIGKGSDPETSGKFGAGVNLLNDKTNALRTTGFGLDVAYHVPLTRFSTVGAGVSVGYLQTMQGAADGQWASQYNGYDHDPDRPSGESFGNIRHAAMDLGGGVVYAMKWGGGRTERSSGFHAGLSALHLGRPQLLGDAADDRIAVRWALFGQGKVMLNAGKNWLSPEAQLFKQGPSILVIAGGSLGHLFGPSRSFQNEAIQVEVELGAAYRSDQAILAKLRIAWSAFAISLVYDIPSGGPDPAHSATGIALGYALDKARN